MVIESGIGEAEFVLSDLASKGQILFSAFLGRYLLGSCFRNLENPSY